MGINLGNIFYKAFNLSSMNSSPELFDFYRKVKSVDQKSVEGTNYLVLNNKYYIPQRNERDRNVKIMKEGKLVNLTEN